MSSTLTYPPPLYPSGHAFSGQSGPRKTIKNLIWLYFWLVIFEGALRKWFLPGLATPLLVVRDPVVIAALALGFSSGLLRWNGWLTATSLIGFASLILALAMGHGNLLVAAFGFRANFLHIPMIFLIGQVFDRRDVEKMCHAVIVVGIGMAFLLALQFGSSAGSWVNVGIGGTGTSTFDAIGEYRRPSGLFSFTNGVALMYSLVAACSIYGVVGTSKPALRVLALCGGLAVAAAIPLSVSRALLLSVAIVGIGGLIALSASGRSIGRIVQGLIGLLLLGALASQIPGLEKPREAFMMRWVASTDKKGGFNEAIVDRLIDTATRGIVTSAEGSDWLVGKGLGAGTNVGAQMLVGDRVFLIAEDEWGRLTGELGWPLGVSFVTLRIALALWLLSVSWKAARQGDPLALILWFSSAIVIPQGQWGQPTALGFAVVGGGMVLAAAQHSSVGFVRQLGRTTQPTSRASSYNQPQQSEPAKATPSPPAKGPSGNIW